MDDVKDILPWHPGVSKGLACGEGWDDLIRRLHNQIVGIDPGYRVMQVKEKLGGLRYYVETSPGLDELLYRRVYEFIAEAGDESYHICEVCGEPGEIRGGSWYRTLCEIHDREREEHYAALRTAGELEES